VAVVQLAALLLLTLQDLGPSYVGLSNLGFSLGMAVLSREKNYHEDTSVPANFRTLIPSNNTATLINGALIVVIVPALASLVFKILSVTCCKEVRRVHRAWKYSLGTFTFYGLLFLAYGELACLAISIKYFKSGMEGGIAVLGGALFAMILAVSMIASAAVPEWFGSFRKNFVKFELSSHFYVFSSAERIVSAVAVIFLSPGMLPAAVVSIILLLETVFIIYKKPYVLQQWRRPLLNKILAIVVCLLYLGASATAADSMVNQFIPLGILAALTLTTVTATVSAVQELRDYWENRE
jgi:hypothetical protein